MNASPEPNAEADGNAKGDRPANPNPTPGRGPLWHSLVPGAMALALTAVAFFVVLLSGPRAAPSPATADRAATLGNSPGRSAVASGQTPALGNAPKDPTPTTARPYRVVALSPGLTTTLRDLGLSKSIVGRHAFDAWCDPSVPVCGDQAGVDAEMLARADPTHVYLQWGQREVPAAVTQLAKDRNWVVRSFSLLTLSEIQQAQTQLFADWQSTLPEPERAKTDFLGSPLGGRWIAATEQRTGPESARFGTLGPALLLFSDRDPVAAAGPGSYHHEVLSRLGCTQAITTGTAYQVLDRETLLRLNPAVIIVLKPAAAKATADIEARPADAANDSSAGAALPPGLTGLPLRAIERGRVIIITDPLAFVPGSNLIRLTEDLRTKLRALTPPPAEQPAPAGKG